jgi:predicted nucleotidyltransferase
MHNNLALARVFPNQTMIEVLIYFLFHPQKKAPLSHIVHGTKKALIQVQRAIKRLVETGLILKITTPKKTYYQANEAHVAYEDLQRLALRSKILSPTFKEELQQIEKKVTYGFIYGSFAKGSHHAMSDLDIFLVGDMSHYDLGTFFFNLGRELVCEVNITIFAQKQLREGIKDQNPFLNDVLKGPKIWLFGNKYEFERLFK